jgi:DNA-directed RNA polymerase subunit beta
VNEGVKYLSAEEEEEKIAQANAPIDDKGKFVRSES